jgi:pyridoxamine 5'-phosphate oxidase
MDFNDFRRQYLSQGLRRNHLNDDPILQFTLWLEQAVIAGIAEPTAMVLATVASDGQPSQRTVLLKHVDDKGLIFYTNKNSRKASELAENNKVSLHFPWHMIDRQVRVYGVAEVVTTAEVLKYFVTRPRESQCAAWASNQSHPLLSRRLLMQKFYEIKEKFSQGKIPLPDFWGGYRIIPHGFEFWQQSDHRLHDRFEYKLRETKDWQIQRLAP